MREIKTAKQTHGRLFKVDENGKREFLCYTLEDAERPVKIKGDTVQLCYQVVGQKAQNIVYDLLVNYAFVDPSFIDKSAWDAEQVGYLPRLYNTLVTTPTGVSKLLTELTEQVGFFLFWDEVNSLIKFQTIRPNSLSETVHELNTTKHLLADSVKMRDIVTGKH